MPGTFVRVGTLGLVILLLLIPTWMVEGLIREREGRRREAVQEVSATWGGPQTVGGPVLTLPFEVREVDGKGKLVVSRDHYWHLLPKTLQVEGSVDPEVRRRGLFEVPLYRTRLRFQGRFVPWGKAGAPDPASIRWDAAQVALPLSETRGLVEQVVLTWDGGRVELSPEAIEGTPTARGLRARLEGLSRTGWERGFDFRVDLVLQGSEQLTLLPLGEATTVSLKSSWSSPGFVGAFLPFERAVGPDGFRATWRVPGLARGIGQQWSSRGGAVAGLERSGFGVRLVVPVDHYQQTSRSVKYALLFLVFTFTAFFLFELLRSARLHPMNYLLVGSAMCVFYLLLLALSEWVAFGLAYGLAAVATIGLIGAYAAAIVRHRGATAALVGVLGGLYGCLYVLLRLEEASLLLGALTLFLALAAVMYLTRRLDWHAPGGRIPREGGAPAAAPVE